MGVFLPGSDPLHKVTIIPRGRALGLTMQLPTEDKYTYRRRFVETQIAILMGGRVAEELTQDDITTGAGNDIERATDLARRMVCEWGMSRLGPLSFGAKDEPVFLGREFAQRADYSQETAQQIDREVQRLVNDGYQRAVAILNERRAILERIARDLLVHESLDGEAVYAIVEEMSGRNVRPERPRPGDQAATRRPGVADSCGGLAARRPAGTTAARASAAFDRTRIGRSARPRIVGVVALRAARIDSTRRHWRPSTACC